MLLLFGWLPFSIGAWLGVGVHYLVAAAAIALGFYLSELFDIAATNPFAALLRPLRYLGYALIIAGACYGYGTWREQKAVSDCISAAQLAAVQSQLDAANASLDHWKETAELRSEQLRELAKRRSEADARVADWQAEVPKLPEAVRRGRAATRDDDRRLCELVRGKAPGC